ncbi:hypothetical protein N7474_003069 [Penicillium riverlandense]|uniref:uncharacterized protein n=1 Tax=Penicillium riverlandense TaxID=1903569 RepID=UPI0025467C48|nr:uncharacterized protein N7474_003069 [Penicillium riverlandense]KAJ5825931.1 hypothetical protein N7474_003069 [Penicillium riverlandense]
MLLHPEHSSAYCNHFLALGIIVQGELFRRFTRFDSPMFKSCNYCRHRKKKCVLDSPWASRCTECDHLDLVCEFSRRQPSLKRRKTSQRIASRVSAVAAAASAPSPAEERQWANTGSIVSVVKDGDSQLNSAGVTHSDGQKIILKDDNSDTPNSTARKYWDYVHPLTPFVPSEMIQDGNESWDPVLHECVELAASIWLHHRPNSDLPQRASDSLALVTQGEMTLQCLAGALLLMLRFPVERDSVQRVSSQSNTFLGFVLNKIRYSAPSTLLYSLGRNYQLPFLRAQSSPTPGFG